MYRTQTGAVLAVTLTVVSALDFVYEQHDAAAHMKESRASAEKEMIYKNQLRLSKQRMRERVDGAKHQRSKWLTGHVQCLLRENVPAARQDEVLHWICSPEGANSTCKGIKPGAAHFQPNTTWDHLQWAMTSYYERHRDEYRHGYRSCWFGGIAFLVPPPVNVLYLVSNPWETVGVGRLAISGEYPVNVGQVLNIPSGDGIVFSIAEFDAKYDRKAETGFKAMVRSAGASEGFIEVQVAFGDGGEVSYDFDGDGHTDRTDRSHVMKVEQTTDFHALVGRFHSNQAAGSVYQDFASGSVVLRVTNTGAADLELLEAGERAPSHLQIPYFPF